MKIINVVGARPNFMKIAPLVEEMNKHPEIRQVLVHTEQHYDEKMSKLFFEDLKLPQPDIFLGIGSCSHAEQTGKIMIEFEKVLLKEKPDLVVVVGDVNSTVACALAAVKLNMPVAHIEAGLRSFDRTMPEEINRIVTDAISDYLFITEKDAESNLIKEGVKKEKIHFVGNVMIDTLLKNIKAAQEKNFSRTLGLKNKEYAVLTLHRPSNVDDKDAFYNILGTIGEIIKHLKVVYPVHPRTRKKINEFGFDKQFEFLSANKSSRDNLLMIDPLGYLEFLDLVSNSKLVLTDSGGIQEETTVLHVPCITLRENTERPITVTEGTNFLTGTSRNKILETVQHILSGKIKFNRIPELWDGSAAKRIVDILLKQRLI